MGRCKKHGADGETHVFMAKTRNDDDIWSKEAWWMAARSGSVEKGKGGERMVWWESQPKKIGWCDEVMGL